jgi:hypothetical protein
MKLFIDDIRNPPDQDWIVARSYNEAITILETGIISVVSLDHDLGEEKTGYDIICWIEEKLMTGAWVFVPEIFIHSANPVGRKNILRAYDSILRYMESAK